MESGDNLKSKASFEAQPAWGPAARGALAGRELADLLSGSSGGISVAHASERRRKYQERPARGHPPQLSCATASDSAAITFLKHACPTLQTSLSPPTI